MPTGLPEIVTWADRATALLQIVGGALVIVCIAFLALTLIFSLGNQNKVEFVRNAFIVVAIGVFLLFAARPISAAVKGLTNALGQPPAQQQPQNVLPSQYDVSIQIMERNPHKEVYQHV